MAKPWTGAICRYLINCNVINQRVKDGTVLVGLSARQTGPIAHYTGEASNEKQQSTNEPGMFGAGWGWFRCVSISCFKEQIHPCASSEVKPGILLRQKHFLNQCVDVGISVWMCGCFKLSLLY